MKIRVNQFLLVVFLAFLSGGTKLILNFRRFLQRTVVKRLALVNRALEERTPTAENLPFEEVWFKSRDGLKLHGWFIPVRVESPAKATIIMGHGHGGSKVYDLAYASFFHGGGYNVFMLDFRGHGQSEGPLGTSMGYWERYDIAGAVDWLLGRDLDQIGIFGISMGGSIAILAAAENPNIKAVVADSAYAHLRRSIAAEINNMTNLPIWMVRPLGWMGYYLLASHHGFSSREGNPASVISKISPRPLFLIHAENDRLTRLENARVLFKLAKEPKELWLQPGIGHVEGYTHFGREYEKRVLDFFNRVDWETPLSSRPPEFTLDGHPIPR